MKAVGFLKNLMVWSTVFWISASALAQESLWRAFETQSADGTRIAYYVAGNLTPGQVTETPLFVVSGGPGSDHRYMRVGGSFDRIAQKRPVVMFDQRGTSKSGPVTGEPRLAQWVEDLEAVRAALDADKIDVLGHSFGGIFAMAYAERFGNYLHSVTFANSTASSIAETKSVLAEVFPDRIQEWQRTRASLPPRFKASAIEILSAMEFVDTRRAEEYINAVADFTYNIEVNNALRRDMADMDFTRVVSSLSVPVLILHGRYDPVIAPSTAWGLHKQIPGSELVILPATGHLPFAEVPDVFVRTVETFLGRASATSEN